VTSNTTGNNVGLENKLRTLLIEMEAVEHQIEKVFFIVERERLENRLFDLKKEYDTLSKNL
jgi:archaellum component FlaC